MAQSNRFRAFFVAKMMPVVIRSINLIMDGQYDDLLIILRTSERRWLYHLGVLVMKVGLILVVMCYSLGAHEVAPPLREERVG